MQSFFQHTVNGVIEKASVLGTDTSSSNPQHMSNGSVNEIQVKGKKLER